MMRRLIAAGMGLALLACSSQSQSSQGTGSAESSPASAETALHPVSGLRVIDLSVTSRKGRHAFRVELAESPQEQARGLMFRTELGKDEGMLFPSSPPGIRSFWMKNTPLSLDIVFIGMDGRIINIADHTEPYSLESVLSYDVALAVLELRAGRCDELDIEPGDKVEWAAP